ncbi:hypothetical protein VMCG_03877 [Cytospora schulzeri]|uniref:Uncharacterized protein n=1 Tax=Cytospora schulzeri TaxID=448051 RepID=A0A423WVK1_9PEZI|nr:hypothetical protein VMCG_03877 [Valsa malicola]
MASQPILLLKGGTLLIHDDNNHVVPTQEDLLIEGSTITKIEKDISPPPPPPTPKTPSQTPKTTSRPSPAQAPTAKGAPTTPASGDPRAPARIITSHAVRGHGLWLAGRPYAVAILEGAGLLGPDVAAEPCAGSGGGGRGEVEGGRGRAKGRGKGKGKGFLGEEEGEEEESVGVDVGTSLSWGDVAREMLRSWEVIRGNIGNVDFGPAEEAIIDMWHMNRSTMVKK